MHLLLAKGIVVNDNVVTRKKRNWLRSSKVDSISGALDLFEAKVVELNEKIVVE